MNSQDIQLKAKRMSSGKSMVISTVVFCYIFRELTGRFADSVGGKSKFILVCQFTKFYFVSFSCFIQDFFETG